MININLHKLQVKSPALISEEIPKIFFLRQEFAKKVKKSSRRAYGRTTIVITSPLYKTKWFVLI